MLIFYKSFTPIRASAQGCQMDVYVYRYSIFFIINVLRLSRPRNAFRNAINLAITRVSSIDIPLKEQTCTFRRKCPSRRLLVERDIADRWAK